VIDGVGDVKWPARIIPKGAGVRQADGKVRRRTDTGKLDYCDTPAP